MGILIKENVDSAEASPILPEGLGEGFKGEARGNSPFVQGEGYSGQSRDPKWGRCVA